MAIFQKKIWICLMGFSVLSIFNMNHSFADDSAEGKSVKESVSNSAKHAKHKTNKGIRKLKDKTCEVVDGKTKCLAKKAEHSVENGVDNVKDAAD
jgi:hypothetical protein